MQDMTRGIYSSFQLKLLRCDYSGEGLGSIKQMRYNYEQRIWNSMKCIY